MKFAFRLMLVLFLLVGLTGCAGFGKIDPVRESYSALNDTFITSVQILNVALPSFSQEEQKAIVSKVVEINDMLDALGDATRAGQSGESMSAAIRAALRALEPYLMKAKAQKKVYDVGHRDGSVGSSYALGYRGQFRHALERPDEGDSRSVHRPEGRFATAVGYGSGSIGRRPWPCRATYV